MFFVFVFVFVFIFVFVFVLGFVSWFCCGCCSCFCFVLSSLFVPGLCFVLLVFVLFFFLLASACLFLRVLGSVLLSFRFSFQVDYSWRAGGHFALIS